MRIIVIDGMGGGIGAELCGRLKAALPADCELAALGTNAVATDRMVRAGASRGASGENAIRVTAPTADIIAGPIGIIIMNSMMGEITAAMVEAILASPAERVVLPLQNEHIRIAGLTGRAGLTGSASLTGRACTEKLNLGKLMDEAVEMILDIIRKKK